MSCVSRALPRLIPEIILAAPKSTEIFIISPWIQDVILKPPVTGTLDNWHVEPEMRLSQLLLIVAERRNLHISIVVREVDHHVSASTKRLKSRFSDALDIYEEEFLHAKVIATDTTILQMSANLIPTSLYRNVENCSLSSNRYQKSRKFIQNDLKIKLKDRK